MAIKGVTPVKRASGQLPHPYATAGFDRTSDYGAGGYRSGQATPQPQMSTVPITQGASGGIGNGELKEDEPRGFSIGRLLKCQCG